MKKRKQPYGRIHSIKLPHSRKTLSLDDSKFCKKSPSVFDYYLSNEKIVNSCMNEASVAILFTYIWLHNSGKALDEIEKNKQTVLMPFVDSLEPLNDLNNYLDVNKTACVCNGKSEHKKPTSSLFLKLLSLPCSLGLS